MSNSNQDSNQPPIFPLTNPKTIDDDDEPERPGHPPGNYDYHVETLPGESAPLDKKSRRFENIQSNTEIRKSIQEALPDPGDTYERWRYEIFKNGLHKLRIWYREPNSRTFVNPPSPYLDDMPPFEDLCKAHDKGAVIRVAVYKPSTYGRMIAITGPLEIPISPEGDYQMSGYGNPFGGSGSGLPFDPFSGMSKMMEFSEKQQSKTDKIHQQNIAMQQQQSNAWLQALMSNNKGNGNDTMMYMMQQQQQQAAQQNQQMMMFLGGLFTNMQQQNQASQQILITALSKNNSDPTMMKFMEMQQSQSNIFLEKALTALGDIGSQIEVLKQLQEFTEPTTLDSIAKIAESINAGEAIANLTGAASDRIRANKPSEEQSEPPPPIPEPANPGQAAAPNPAAAAPPPAAHAPAAQAAPANTQNKVAAQETGPTDLALFGQIVGMIKQSYLSGHDPVDLANSIRQADTGNLVSILKSRTAPELIGYLHQYADALNCKELTSTAGRQFVLSFLYQIQSTEEGTVDNGQTPPLSAEQG